MELFEAILLTTVTAATPLLLAALGELVTERSGVLNLGVEGMMIMGAVAGFAFALMSGNAYVGIVGGVVVGALFSLCFAFLAVTLVTNQVATGLSLTILGLGISGLWGEAFIGVPGIKLQPIIIPILSDIPLIGKLLFAQDIIFYMTIALLIGVNWFLYRSRAGLILRSVGDNHTSAHSLGISVLKVRYLAVVFGGACSGLAGAYMSLVYTTQWIEGMTAGRGWIALALVVFASWKPTRVLVGAYLFGLMGIAQLHIQALGFDVPSQFLSALPYLATIVVLVAISTNRRLTFMNTPSELGKGFVPDR